MFQLVSTLLIFFSLLFPGFSHADKADELTGTMRGKVYVDEKPVPYAIVAFFGVKMGLPPVGSGVMRLPDSVGRADGEGKFEIKLASGQYYIGILPRAEEEPTGPPRRGEIFYFANDGQKHLKTLAVDNGKLADVGQVNGLKRPEILIGDESDDFFTVEGTVFDGNTNKPYAGARVLAKKKPDHGKPDFFGTPTGSDGKFSLKLPVGMPLFLIAREDITGIKPRSGDKIGTYGINTPFGASKNSQTGGPKGPPSSGVKENLYTGNADQDLAITGTKGQIMPGLVIHMYAVPDHQEGQENTPKQSGSMLLKEGSN